MQVVDRRPATDDSASLYGFSVASDDDYTYLYAHCYRQFGWDAFPFVSPPVYVHDWDCAGHVTVARVPSGHFDQRTEVLERHRRGSPTRPAPSAWCRRDGWSTASQFYRDGDRWIADHEGGRLVGRQDRPSTWHPAAGPVHDGPHDRHAGQVLHLQHLLRVAPAVAERNGSLLLAISNNMFDRLDLCCTNRASSPHPAGVWLGAGVDVS